MSGPGMPGWRQITCEESDVVRKGAAGVGATLTDLMGQFGEPRIYTEWVDADDKPILRSHRWPSPDGPDGRPCHHEVPALELVARGTCECCGEPTDTPPECPECVKHMDVTAAKAWREGQQ